MTVTKCGFIKFDFVSEKVSGKKKDASSTVKLEKGLDVTLY